VLAAAALSLLMEALQSYLPSRVASNVDFGSTSWGA
jgi:VanZ family protein